MNNQSQEFKNSKRGIDKIGEIFISFDKANSYKIPFPPIGFCRLPSLDQLSKTEISSLANLNFSFYTILLNLISPDWQIAFKMANNEAKGLKIPMQVILQFGDDIENALKEFIELCNTIFPFVEEVILIEKENKLNPSNLLNKVLPYLREGLHHVKIGIGAYTELEGILKQKPDLNEADFLSLPFQATISLDSISDLQTKSARQIDLIREFKAAFPSKQIYVVPMSLNSGLAMLSEDSAKLLSNENSLLLYLAASGKPISILKTLIFSGIDSISFYENRGKSELFATDTSNIKVENINSIPFFYCLREILEMNNGFIIQAENSSPSHIDAFIASARGKIKVMLINLTSEEQSISLSGISHHAKIEMFDSKWIKKVLARSNENEIPIGQELSFHDGRTNILVEPFGIALIQE